MEVFLRLPKVLSNNKRKTPLNSPARVSRRTQVANELDNPKKRSKYEDKFEKMESASIAQPFDRGKHRQLHQQRRDRNAFGRRYEGHNTYQRGICSQLVHNYIQSEMREEITPILVQKYHDRTDHASVDCYALKRDRKQKIKQDNTKTKATSKKEE
ncbi:hypothetical protein L1887_36347 [Cichorium endivia]|nr:hypothetical protein L1887_36347 [Cichorium endivia]